MKSLTHQYIFHGSYEKTAFSGSEEGQSEEDGVVQNLVSDYRARSVSREEKFQGFQQKLQFDKVTEADPEGSGISDTANISKSAQNDTKIDDRILPLSKRDYRGKKSLAVARSSRSIKQWEGVVEEIVESVFTARLLDVTSGQKVPEEEGVFEIGDLSRRDQKNLQVGSVFRGYVGFESLKGGQKRRVSEFYFRPTIRSSSKSKASALEEVHRTISEITFDE